MKLIDVLNTVKIESRILITIELEKNEKYLTIELNNAYKERWDFYEYAQIVWTNSVFAVIENLSTDLLYREVSYISVNRAINGLSISCYL